MSSSSDESTPSQSANSAKYSSVHSSGSNTPFPSSNSLLRASEGYCPYISPPLTAPPNTSALPPQAWSVPNQFEVSVLAKSETVKVVTFSDMPNSSIAR